MAEIRITTAPGCLLSGGTEVFETRVRPERQTSYGRAGFPEANRAQRGLPQFLMPIGAGWQLGANKQQSKHVVTDVPTGVPPSAGERRP